MSAVSEIAFSVVIPLYNKEVYIDRALGSVLAQSLPPVEIIVVDDGSSDHSVEKVAAFGDPRIVVINQANAGPGAARNRGAQEAKNPWIAFLDADDYWEADHLATLAALIRRFPEARLVAGAYGLGQRNGARKERAPSHRIDAGKLVDDFFFVSAVRGMPVHSSSVALHRTSFLETGGFKPLFMGEDIDLWCRMALAYPVAVSPLRTAVYDNSTGGLCSQGNQPGAFKKVGSRADVMGLTPVLASLRDHRRRTGVSTFGQRLFIGLRLAMSVKARFARRDFKGVFLILTSPAVLDIGLFAVVRGAEAVRRRFASATVSTR